MSDTTQLPAQHHRINYIELAAHNLEATQAFFERAFGWTFQSYGPDYAAFFASGVDGGFFRVSAPVPGAQPLASLQEAGGALVVLFSSAIDASLAAVEAAGGRITKPIFEFPGGRRFQFLEPSGNELAVWAAPL